ncbi:hypothetical protein FRB99_008611 [Tulasnella sp. 403]|nr:hypothetical protein FRB99_008611 [Tulasnella sp. 403]
MKATNDVTEAFRRTANLMQQELERSVLTQQMFDDSSRTLTVTSDLYSTFTGLLNTSKTLVTALEKSDYLDRLLIISSLILFLSVVAYILKRRIVDRGIALAFWWVKYVPGLQGGAARVRHAVPVDQRVDVAPADMPYRE